MLLSMSIFALVYMAFRYPSLLKQSQEAESSTNLLKVLFLYPAGFLFLVMSLLSGMLGVTYLTLIFLAAPAAAKFDIPRWVYLSGFLLIGAAIYYSPMKEAFALRRDALAYQKVYPLESLSERLAYESKSVASLASEVTENSVPVLSDSEGPLSAPPAPEEFLVLKISSENVIQRAHFGDGAFRTNALMVVHTLWQHRFQNLVGNGNIRMQWRRDWRDHLREGVDPEDFYLPDEYTPEDQYREDVIAAQEMAEFLGPASDPERPGTDLHQRTLVDFVRTSGWGYVKSLEEVAGFKPHRFRNRPVMLDPETRETNQWRLTRLELVSLLKHDTPQVYLSDALPNMETLSSEDVPTRELARFERRALDLLESGNDLVIDEQPTHIRMLGALRAVQDCLQCHEVPEHTLLGAFTYELRKPVVSLSKQ